MKIYENLFRDGYILVKNALNLPSNIEEIFDIASETCTGKSLRNWDGLSSTPSATMGVEKDINIAKVLEKTNLQPLIDAFMGTNIKFWGSDLSTFDKSSQWHKDVACEVPIYKIAIYLDGSYGKDQTFLVVPGSHHINDKYAKLLNKYLLWPNGGGINENGFNNIYNFENNEWKKTLNTVQLQVDRGDIIIFDQRIIHTALSDNVRRLIALSFIPEYEDAIEMWAGITPKPQSSQEYYNYLFKLRCAMRKVESPRFINYQSTHQKLPFLETTWKKYAFFNRWQENDYIDGVKSFFPGENGIIKAMNVINAKG